MAKYGMPSGLNSRKLFSFKKTSRRTSGVKKSFFNLYKKSDLPVRAKSLSCLYATTARATV